MNLGQTPRDNNNKTEIKIMQLTPKHLKILRQASQLVIQTEQRGFSYRTQEKNGVAKEIIGLKVDSKNPDNPGETRYHQSIIDQNDRKSGAFGIFSEVSLSVKADKEGDVYEIKKIKNNIEIIFLFKNGQPYDLQEKDNVFNKKSMKLTRFRMLSEERESYIFSRIYFGKSCYIELKDYSPYKGVFLMKNFKGKNLDDYWDEYELNGSNQNSMDSKKIFSDLLKTILGAAISVERLHKIGFSHNDIKKDNFILFVEKDGFFDVNVIDFGFSREHRNEQKNIGSDFFLFQKMIFSFKEIIKLLESEVEVEIFLERFKTAASNLYSKDKKDFSFQPFIDTCIEILSELDPTFSKEQYLLNDTEENKNTRKNEFSNQEDEIKTVAEPQGDDIISGVSQNLSNQGLFLDLSPRNQTLGDEFQNDSFRAIDSIVKTMPIR